MCNNMKPSRLAESDKMDEVAVPEQQLAADDGTDDDMPGLEPVEEESWPVEEESKRRAGGKEIKLGVKEPARRGDSDETVWSCACTLAPKQCRCGIDAVQQDLCIERLNSLNSRLLVAEQQGEGKATQYRHIWDNFIAQQLGSTATRPTTCSTTPRSAPHGAHLNQGA